VSKRNVFGGTFLHTACQNKDDPVLVEMLASVPLPIDAVDLKGDSALTYATWQDHTENVRKLLDLGAQPERLNAVGDGAINMAVYHNAPACLGVLLERNVAVSHVNSRSETLLHAAGLVPRVETIRRLAEADLHTLDPAALDINGKSYKDYFMERADLRDLDLVEAFGLLVAHVEKAHT
jgi:ankyrin repeat protein